MATRALPLYSKIDIEMNSNSKQKALREERRGGELIQLFWAVMPWGRDNSKCIKFAGFGLILTERLLILDLSILIVAHSQIILIIIFY